MGAKGLATLAGVAGVDAAAYLNPALAAEEQELHTGMWIAQLYELPDLRVYGAYGSVGTTTFGASGSYSGLRFDEFSTGQLLVNVAAVIRGVASQNPRLGAGLLIVRVRSSQESAHVRLILRHGILLPLGTRIRLGARLQRAIAGDAGVASGFSESYLLGLAYAAHEKITLVSDVLFDRYFPASYRFGFVSGISESFTVRLGHSINPSRLAFGFSVFVGNQGFHFAFDRHHLLGWSVATELDVRFPTDP